MRRSDRNSKLLRISFYFFVDYFELVEHELRICFGVLCLQRRFRLFTHQPLTQFFDSFNNQIFITKAILYVWRIAKNFGRKLRVAIKQVITLILWEGVHLLDESFFDWYVVPALTTRECLLEQFLNRHILFNFRPAFESFLISIFFVVGGIIRRQRPEEICDIRLSRVIYFQNLWLCQIRK